MNVGVRAATATVAIFALAAPQAPASTPAVEQWHLGFLGMEEAHHYSEGHGVVVAVIDSGVDASHPDLAGSVLAGVDFTIGNPDGDGRTDVDGHGTAMAGLIAAHGRSQGIAPEAEILPIRNSAADLAGETSAGIDWAVAHGARVLCVAQNDNDLPRLRASVRRAIAADVVIVAAAGNRPKDSGVVFPARYDGVIAAGGVDRDGNHAAVSVTGPEISLVAPAVEIRSPYRDHGYGVGTGTSSATAIIAGVAALVRAKHPQLSAAEVVDLLIRTATDKGPPGHDDEYGYGVVDPVAALTTPLPSPGRTSAIGPTTASEQPPGGQANRGHSRGTAALPAIASALAVAAVLGIALYVWLHRTRRRRWPRS